MIYPPEDELPDFAPPDDPWEELKQPERPIGYFSYYYSDELSKYPVRDVTRPNDNKSDPNLETMSYGLFSSCERGMRAGIVKNTRPYVFFITKRNDERVLTGYYRTKWYTEGNPVFSYLNRGSVLDDYLIVADKMKFIYPPISLEDLAKRFDDEFYSDWFRTFKKTDEVQTEELLELLEEQEDRSADYIEEIRRLERVNKRYHGYTYTNWEIEVPFSWEEAEDYVVPSNSINYEELRDELGSISASGVSNWLCQECDHTVESEALLKRCPNCNMIGTLLPDER